MLLHFLFILGISVEAITGAIAAGRKKMDFFGVILIATITGLGGGTVRDIVLNTHPLTWVSHPYYLLFTTSAAFLTIFLAPSVLRIMRVFLILDALGLATFVIIGTQKAMSYNMSFSVCVISGMITGVSGGVLRDILCNDIPLVLRSEIYALIALFGALLYYVMKAIELPHYLIVTTCLSSMFALRVFAIIFHIEMPKFDYGRSLRKSLRRRH
jgi:uncharacterized membrane protein YeiH